MVQFYTVIPESIHFLYHGVIPLSYQTGCSASFSQDDWLQYLSTREDQYPPGHTLNHSPHWTATLHYCASLYNVFRIYIIYLFHTYSTVFKMLICSAYLGPFCNSGPRQIHCMLIPRVLPYLANTFDVNGFDEYLRNNTIDFRHSTFVFILLYCHTEIVVTEKIINLRIQ